jgi:hypothetical protein
MANQPAYGDVVVRLEAAALAIGRLDAALSGHPLLPAWTFWSQLDTARRHAEADGRRVDLYRLAAFLHGLPLRVAAPCPWPSGEATSPPSPTPSSCAPGQSSPMPNSRICSTGV